jgi:hypothetical protein
MNTEQLLGHKHDEQLLCLEREKQLHREDFSFCLLDLDRSKLLKAFAK